MWKSPIPLVLLCLVAISIQTLRLDAETVAHATTKQQWAVENAQAAKQLAGLSEKYRTTERHLKERADAALDSYINASEQGEMARADARRAAERLRQLALSAASAAQRLPGAAADSGPAGADCSARLTACGQLLAQGASLVAGGASMAAEGGELVDQLDAKVTLCHGAWPQLQGEP